MRKNYRDRERCSKSARATHLVLVRVGAPREELPRGILGEHGQRIVDVNVEVIRCAVDQPHVLVSSIRHTDSLHLRLVSPNRLALVILRLVARSLPQFSFNRDAVPVQSMLVSRVPLVAQLDRAYSESAPRQSVPSRAERETNDFPSLTNPLALPARFCDASEQWRGRRSVRSYEQSRPRPS